MAIKKINKWVRERKFPGLTPKKLPNDPESLIIELNPVFHDVAARVFGYGKYDTKQIRAYINKLSYEQLYARYYSEVLNEIMTRVKAIPEPDTLVLVVDGVAPVAKMTQQRQRRYGKPNVIYRDDLVLFDSNSISPCTELMFALDAEIKLWIDQNRSKLPRRVLYSSHLKPGEGEHKIMDFFRDGTLGNIGPHVIYSADGDMYMLSLVAPAVGMFLARNNHFTGELEYVNIEALKRFLSEELIKPTAVADFVFMLYLWGNDFLPHQVSFYDLDVAIEETFAAYHETSVGLTNLETGDLDMVGVAEFFSHLANREFTLIAETALQPYKHKLQELVASVKITQDANAQSVVELDNDLFRRNWNTKIVAPYEHENLSFDIKEEDLSEMVAEASVRYITSLQWIFRYYTKGLSKCNYDYFYPYHYAPLFTDLAPTANAFVTVPDAIKEALGPNKYTFRKAATPFHPLMQLGLIIPESSMYVVDSFFESLWTSRGSKSLNMYQPGSADIDIYNAGLGNEEVRSDDGVRLIGFFDPDHVRTVVFDLLSDLASEERYDELMARYDEDTEYSIPDKAKRTKKYHAISDFTAPTKEEQVKIKVASVATKNIRAYDQHRFKEYEATLVQLNLPTVSRVLIVDSGDRGDTGSLARLFPESKVSVINFRGDKFDVPEGVLVLSKPQFDALSGGEFDLILVNMTFSTFVNQEILAKRLNYLLGDKGYLVVRDYEAPTVAKEAQSFRSFVELSDYANAVVKNQPVPFSPNIQTHLGLKTAISKAGFKFTNRTALNPAEQKRKYMMSFVKDKSVESPTPISVRVSVVPISQSSRFKDLSDTQLVYISKIISRSLNSPDVTVDILTKSRATDNDFDYITKLRARYGSREAPSATRGGASSRGSQSSYRGSSQRGGAGRVRGTEAPRGRGGFRGRATSTETRGTETARGSSARPARGRGRGGSERGRGK